MKSNKLKAGFRAWLSMGLTGVLLSPCTSQAQSSTATAAQQAPDCPIKTVFIGGNQRISNGELEQYMAQQKLLICQPEDVEDLRISLTQYYISKGYINSGALLVPQSATEQAQGLQRLQITEGRIRAIQVKGLGDVQAGYLQQRLPAIDKVLYLPELQTAYQNLLSDPLFSKVQSRLLPGAEAGSAILDLELERARAWGAQLTVDNYRAPAIGELGLSLAFWKRNLTGYGDLLELSTTHSQGADPGSISWTVPIFGYSNSLRLRADRGNTRVISDTLAELDIRSKSSGWEIAYQHKLPARSNWQQEFSVALAQRDNQNTLAGMPFSFSAGELDGYAQIRRLHLAHEIRWFQADQAWSLQNAWVLGKNRQNPGTGSTPGFKAHYNIWQGQFQYLWQARENAQVSTSMQWQWSRDSLLNLERYALGGVHSLPGYRENSLQGNKGLLLQSRWQQALAQPDLSWFVAAQAGLVVADAATRQHLASLSLGWKWQHGPWQAELTLAKGLNSGPGLAAKQAWQDRGLHFSLAYKLF